MKLSILALDETLFEGEAKTVSAPGVFGRLQVLEHHIPLITALKSGIIRVETEKGIREFEITSGVIEVRPDEINILIS